MSLQANKDILTNAQQRIEGAPITDAKEIWEEYSVEEALGLLSQAYRLIVGVKEDISCNDTLGKVHRALNEGQVSFARATEGLDDNVTTGLGADIDVMAKRAETEAERAQGLPEELMATLGLLTIVKQGLTRHEGARRRIAEETARNEQAQINVVQRLGGYITGLD